MTSIVLSWYAAALKELKREIHRGTEEILYATDHGVEDGLCSEGYQRGLLLRLKCEALISFDRRITEPHLRRRLQETPDAPQRC